MARSGGGCGLELRELEMRYDDHVVLDGVSLDAQPGEFITLLGPSGSGKTTTLNLIAGFARPTKGTILLDGKAVEDIPPNRRDIGMVFQQYALFPHLTAYDNVAFPLRRRRIKGAQLKEMVDQAFELVRLVGYEQHYPRQLSGGQQQRVAFARAIVFKPRLLLMDEPLGALDRRLRETLQFEITRLHRRLGITFLYVTHDQDEALALSQRIAVYNGGRIEQLGTPPELYETPASLFVADFLGDSTKFAGTVGDGGEIATINGPGHSLRARNTNGLREGDAAVIVVRPDRIALTRVDGTLDSAAVDGHNCMLGHVSEATYLGAAQRLEVALERGGNVVARRQVGEQGHMNEGDRVAVTWAPDDGVLLADTTPRSAADPAPETRPRDDDVRAV